ncbi:hypothetical protein D3C75_990040 [compost metagenome]
MILALVEAEAEIIRQPFDHFADIGGFNGKCQPIDGVQCVIQKMRIDLGLQGSQLGLPLQHLGTVRFLHQVFHPVDQIVYAALQQMEVTVPLRTLLLQPVNALCADHSQHRPDPSVHFLDHKSHQHKCQDQEHQRHSD